MNPSAQRLIERAAAPLRGARKVKTAKLRMMRLFGVLEALQAFRLITKAEADAAVLAAERLADAARAQRIAERAERVKRAATPKES